MKSYHKLSDAELAQHFMRFKDVTYQPASAASLVEDVRSWLRSAGLGHRAEDAVDVAIAAHEIMQQIRQQSAPEAQVTWQANVQEGTTRDDMALQYADDLALAGQVAQMDMDKYAANRTKLGTHVGLAAFLGGQG